MWESFSEGLQMVWGEGGRGKGRGHLGARAGLQKELSSQAALPLLGTHCLPVGPGLPTWQEQHSRVTVVSYGPLSTPCPHGLQGGTKTTHIARTHAFLVCSHGLVTKADQGVSAHFRCNIYIFKKKKKSPGHPLGAEYNSRHCGDYKERAI